MDIYFLCPKCDTKFAIDESGAGMIFRCTNCNTKIIVPEPTKPAPTVPKVVPPPAPSPIAPPPLVALSPAVTPVSPPPPTSPPPPKSKTEKIPESQLPQQAAPPPPKPPAPSPATQKVVIPKISVETPPPAVAPPPSAPAKPEQQLSERSAALDSANARIAALQRDLDTRSNELQETESTARAAREEAAKVFESLNKQLAEARSKSAETQAQVAQLQAAVQSAPNSDALQSLRQQLAAQQQRVSELERYEQLSVELQAHMRDLKTDLAEREKQFTEQQQAFSNLQSQLAQTRQAHQKKQSETESRVVALATEKAELERRLESHESHIRQLETLAAQAPAVSEMMRLQEELRQRAAEIADLRHANEDLAASSHAQLTETQEHLAALQRQLEQSQFASAEQLQRAQAEIQSLHSDAHQQRASFDEERARLAQEIATSLSRAQQLEARLSDREKMLAAAALTGDQRFNQAQDDLRAVREESQRQVAALQRELDARNSQLQTLRAQLAEKEQALSVTTDDAQQKLQQLESALDALQRETAHTLAQGADEKSRLAAQGREATEELASLREHLATVPTTDEVKKLRASLVSAQKEKSAAEEKLAAAEESARTASSDLSAKLKRALDDKSDVQARLRATEADLAIAREKLLFFERHPAPPAEEGAPEISETEKPAADSFPPPAPIFSFSGATEAPSVSPEDIPETDDLKSDTPPPLRFKTASEPSAHPALPESRHAPRGNGESYVAVAEAPTASQQAPKLGEIPSYTPRSRSRPSRLLVMLFVGLALAFAGIGFLFWYQYAGHTALVDAAKFQPVFASAQQIEDHTRTGPQPHHFAELLGKLEADVNATTEKADRGNERRLAEQMRGIVSTYKDSQTLWDLTRQNNNIAPVTDERIRALAAAYNLRLFRIPNRDEEFVDGREGVPIIWAQARQQVIEAKDFVRAHQPPQ